MEDPDGCQGHGLLGGVHCESVQCRLDVIKIFCQCQSILL